MMRQIAQSMGKGVWEDAQKGLIAEIHRLANIVIKDPNGPGWATLPLHGSVEKGYITAEDLDEINGVLIFFICASCMHTRNQIPGILAGMQLWGTLTSLLSVTEYAASLQTLTEEETGLTMATPSSVPS